MANPRGTTNKPSLEELFKSDALGYFDYPDLIDGAEADVEACAVAHMLWIRKNAKLFLICGMPLQSITDGVTKPLNELIDYKRYLSAATAIGNIKDMIGEAEADLEQEFNIDGGLPT